MSSTAVCTVPAYTIPYNWQPELRLFWSLVLILMFSSAWVSKVRCTDSRRPYCQQRDQSYNIHQPFFPIFWHPLPNVGTFFSIYWQPCPNVSTTLLRQWGFRQCLPFSWTTLRGKQCRHPIAVMGVVAEQIASLMAICSLVQVNKKFDAVSTGWSNQFWLLLWGLRFFFKDLLIWSHL